MQTMKREANEKLWIIRYPDTYPVLQSKSYSGISEKFVYKKKIKI